MLIERPTGDGPDAVAGFHIVKLATNAIDHVE
jgi:hypothetical protein